MEVFRFSVLGFIRFYARMLRGGSARNLFPHSHHLYRYSFFLHQMNRKGNRKAVSPIVSRIEKQRTRRNALVEANAYINIQRSR